MRQSTEADARASIAKNFFRAAFMDHAMPKLIYDPDSLRLLEVNSAAVRMYGYTRAEMLEMTVMDLRPADLVEQVRSIVTSKGPPRRNLTVHKTRDGTELEVNVYSQLIDYGSGVARMATIMRAVAREKALQEDGLLLELVLRKLPALVWTTDAASRITRVEGGALAVVGLSRDQVVGRPLTDFFDSASDIVRCHHRALQGVRGGCDAVFQDRVFSAALEPLRGESDEIVGVIGISFDVTDRQEAEERLHESEEQLWQSQKLETVGRLAGGLAHDFNNVLGVVAGQAELLKHMSNHEDPQRGCAEEILRATERANALTRQLLAFSRRQVIQPQVIDLRNVVAEMEKMLRRLIGRGIELRISLSAAPALVFADFTQLEQVLLNLIINAGDAMPDGGTLAITVDTIEATDMQVVSGRIVPGCYVRLGVADTGSGIPAEVLPQVFEPFFTTKDQGRGTGLGLPTVRGIVDQSGGYINITTEVGVGTRFDILLPRITEPAEPSLPLPVGKSAAQ